MIAAGSKVLWEHAAPAAGGYREVGPDAVAQVAEHVRVVDVREPDEYEGELGHVPGSELVPLDTVTRRFEREDRDALVVLVCRSGGRSGNAAEQLARLGFRHVVNMSGGMMAWNEHGLPVERCARPDGKVQ